MPSSSTDSAEIGLPTRPVRRANQAPVTQEPVAAALLAGRWEDVRNVALVVGGWLALLVLVPPQHEYPIIDDWNHARSVQTMLETGAFVLPPTMQANLVGLTVWGALWSKVLGFSFTTLTYSTLFFSLLALVTFYGLARTLGVPPWGALLGTGLLAYNPIFVHLSYSFMTDVPFVGLVLMACYCYVQGVRRGSTPWLVAGGLFAGWAFLIRQFGMLVPLAFLLYLGADSLLRRKLRWEEMWTVGLVPGLVVCAWYIWLRSPPTVGMAAAASRTEWFLMKEPWLRVAGLRALALLPITALSAWAALKMRRGARLLVVPWAALAVWGVYALDLPNEMIIQMYEPPFTAKLGPLSITFPQEAFTFGDWGNIVRPGGIDFFEYDQQAVWSPEVWRGLWALGLALGVVLLAKMTASFLGWLVEVARHRTLSPRAAVYALGAIIFVVSIAFLGDVYDRYMFGFLPFVILFVVRGSSDWGRLAWGYSITTLALIATFTVLAKADNVEHNNVRWQAGHWLQARAPGLHGGYDWDNWMGNRNDDYQITDRPLPGYDTVAQFPYTTRLGGFTTRYVLAQVRTGAPPLREPGSGR